jgi:hypothetical protein
MQRFTGIWKRKFIEPQEGLRRVNIKFIIPMLWCRVKESKFLQSLDEKTRDIVIEFSINPKSAGEDFEHLFYLYCKWYDDELNLEEMAIEFRPQLERLAYRETYESDLWKYY